MLLTLALTLLVAPVPAATAADLPPGPASPAPAPNPIDAYVSYDQQDTCDPAEKPGTRYLADLIFNHWRTGRRPTISRNCTSGGASEHKEGRAFDWGVRADVPHEAAAADAAIAWLTAPGPDGKRAYNARRLGVMYIIWNGRIFSNSSEKAEWKPYTGSNPHTDHVHVSLGWNGAWMRSSWWTGVAIPSEATTRRYVTLVYRDLFGRRVDDGGLKSWTHSLTSGTPRIAVANAITSSPEYRTGLIRRGYQEFLGRDAEAGGLGGWLEAMRKGMTIQTMESGFLASPEYYAQAGGDDAGWVRRLYGHVLDREPSEAEVQGWVDQLAAGKSRQAVSMGFLISAERLSTVINGYYQHLLGRGIDGTGRIHWVAAVQSGVRTEAIIGGIVASAEYYRKAEYPQS